MFHIEHDDTTLMRRITTFPQCTCDSVRRYSLLIHIRHITSDIYVRTLVASKYSFHMQMHRERLHRHSTRYVM